MDVTTDQMSRGVYAQAESILTLKTGVEQAQAERDEALAERDQARQDTAALLAYQTALAQHVDELEARWQELCALLPPAQRALEVQVQDLRGAARELDERLVRKQAIERQLDARMTEKEEAFRRLMDRYTTLEGLVNSRQGMMGGG
jgi:chromosome segregation ATPase